VVFMVATAAQIVDALFGENTGTSILHSYQPAPSTSTPHRNISLTTQAPSLPSPHPQPLFSPPPVHPSTPSPSVLFSTPNTTVPMSILSTHLCRVAPCGRLLARLRFLCREMKRYFYSLALASRFSLSRVTFPCANKENRRLRRRNRCWSAWRVRRRFISSPGD